MPGLHRRMPHTPWSKAALPARYKGPFRSEDKPEPAEGTLHSPDKAADPRE
ncbi:hypothetical protein JCM17042A_02720 [Ruminococcus champanellensis 18P13 = JCM 17042]